MPGGYLPGQGYKLPFWGRYHKSNGLPGWRPQVELGGMQFFRVWVFLGSLNCLYRSSHQVVRQMVDFVHIFQHDIALLRDVDATDGAVVHQEPVAFSLDVEEGR